MAKKKASKTTRNKAKKIAVEYDENGGVANPVDIRDSDDPGDATLRAYRYQIAYGVILLAGMATRELAYKSLWCEHHDDFLAQLNGEFHSYQIKTRQPENGAWLLGSDGFVSAVKKFAILETRFPGRITKYHFVSNTEVSDSNAAATQHKSPRRLFEAIARVKDASSLKPPFDAALAALAKACDATPECIFIVFTRIGFVKGPSRDDFESIISQSHIAKIADCRSFSPYQLNSIRDEIIQAIFDASSRTSDDPSKHWYCVNGDAKNDPFVQAKQILPSVISDAVRSLSQPHFRFSPIATKTDKRLAEGGLTILEKKLLRGGLRGQSETMRRRTVSAEKHLLEIAAATPDKIREIRNQLEQKVQAVCDDASLQTMDNGRIDGLRMLSQVQQKLEKLADESPSMVHHQPYDCLVGMAGLLTEECTVWWSEEFDLSEETA